MARLNKAQMRQAVIDTLRSARAKLLPKGAWGTGLYASTAAGRPIGPKCENAVCFCAVGAIKAVAPTKAVENQAIFALARMIDPELSHAAYAEGVVTGYNDERASKTPVIRRFDLAIDKVAA